MIHCNDSKDVYKLPNLSFWLVSSFKAGFLNSFGFLLTGKFVSHVTGFGTQVGIAVGHHEYFFGSELLIIPLSFIFGGVTTSFFLDKEYEKTELPPYWKIQGLITIFIIAILYLGLTDVYSDKVPFDTDEKYTLTEFFVIASLCYICGLKNSLVSWASWGRIKVTHLTGLSTDIGLNLFRTLNRNKKSPRFHESKRVNIVRIFTFISFSSGAALSAVLFPVYGFKILTLPLFLSVGMTLVSIFETRVAASAIELSDKKNS